MIIGTLGAPLKNPHARIVKENVAKPVSENYILVGNYICRGSIDLYRTSKKLAIPGQERIQRSVWTSTWKRSLPPIHITSSFSAMPEKKRFRK